MKNYFIVIIMIFFLLSCAERKGGVKNMPQDTASTVKADSTKISNEGKELLVQRGSYEDKRYTAIAFSRYIIPEKITEDSSYYFDETLLMLTDKKENRTYKIKLESQSTEIAIDNVTTSLQFKNLLLEVSSQDFSDQYLSEFIELKKDSLHRLFEITDTRPAELSRVNANTLAGTVKDRDEIVYNSQDYPVTVSLLDYSVTITKPLRQQIDYTTECLKTIHGIQINKDSSTRAYTIKEGTKLILDSIFRDTKQVRLIIKDSIIVICPISEVTGRLQGNTAG